MCLILTAAAALIVTAIGYFSHFKRGIGTLALIYWGASLMWTVDGFFALSAGEAFGEFSWDDTFLGLTVILGGLIIWLITSILQKIWSKSLVK